MINRKKNMYLTLHLRISQLKLPRVKKRLNRNIKKQKQKLKQKNVRAKQSSVNFFFLWCYNKVKNIF